jgi:hypothetical protein
MGLSGLLGRADSTAELSPRQYAPLLPNTAEKVRSKIERS